MAAPRFLALVTGRIKQVVAIATSAGAGDAEKIPSLNADGILDDSILGAAETGNSKVLKTKSDGKIDSAVLPTGIGPDTVTVTTSENLAAGDIVNIYNNSTVATARKGDSTAEGKEAVGFVLAGSTSGANASVYLEGTITGLSGLTPGTRYYLDKATPGGITATPPAVAGNVVQYVGTALNATSLSFEPSDPVTVA